MYEYNLSWHTDISHTAPWSDLRASPYFPPASEENSHPQLAELQDGVPPPNRYAGPVNRPRSCSLPQAPGSISNLKSRAISILLSGKNYQVAFRRSFLPSIQLYAQRHGYDLLILSEEELRSTFDYALPLAPPSWLKTFLIQHTFSQGYDQVLLLDADIFINPAAPDIFAACPTGTIGACFDPVVPPDKFALWYERGGAGGTLPRMINAGVLAVHRSCLPVIQHAIDRIRSHVTPTQFANRLYEQPLVSFEILYSPCFLPLPPAFNFIVASAREIAAPRFHRLRTSLNLAVDKYPTLKAWRPSFYAALYRLPLSPYRSSHRALIHHLLREAHFLHFADMWDERIILTSFLNPKGPSA
ncbi:hypothetical protein BH09VER1_BH09VER1_50670 [soil metagenome]